MTLNISYGMLLKIIYVYCPVFEQYWKDVIDSTCIYGSKIVYMKYLFWVVWILTFWSCSDQNNIHSLLFGFSTMHPTY